MQSIGKTFSIAIKIWKYRNNHNTSHLSINLISIIFFSWDLFQTKLNLESVGIIHQLLLITLRQNVQPWDILNPITISTVQV
jgi:hypothetical protein